MSKSKKPPKKGQSKKSLIGLQLKRSIERMCKLVRDQEMNEQKNLYRSRDAIVSGVSAGVAEYFNIDPVVVRILVIILTVVTGGLLAVAYIALWVILPKAPDEHRPVDVQPQEVRSETYGTVDYKPHCSSTHARKKPTGYTTAGHVPPEPPIHYTHAKTNHASCPPPAAYSRPVSQSADNRDVSEDTFVMRPLVRAALWFGFLLLSFGAAVLFGSSVVGVECWQFWPLLFIIFGLGQMIIPGRPGKKVNQFVGGLMLFSVGAVLLPIYLGLLEVESLFIMVQMQWPLLVAIAIFFILAAVTKSPTFMLCAGFAFLAFCFLGVVWWAVPTPTDTIIIEFFGKSYIFDMGRWA